MSVRIRHRYGNAGPFADTLKAYDGVTFHRVYNAEHVCDNLNFIGHHPPEEFDGDTITRITVGGVSLPTDSNPTVEWTEGFFVPGPRPDLKDKWLDYQLTIVEVIPLSEACKRMEERTVGPRLIREKEEKIKKLQEEIESLKRQK